MKVITGDCRQVLDLHADSTFDSCVTDPPYGLRFMGKAWDYDVPTVDTWREVLRVLKPGGALLAFAGSRTYHRMAVAIEDAGFEIRDQIMWIYGSGFPKSHNGPWGGTALKPAHEPIVVARKPLVGTVAANVVQFGTGGLNIDGCRTDAGRWPANVVHDGHADVLATFPDAPGQMADASTESDERKTQNVYGAMKRGRELTAETRYTAVGGTNFAMKPGARRGDIGSAARFFYCAKASKADRNDGCEGLPLRPSGMVSNNSGQHITRRDGGAPGPTANNHPTVKPTALMRYLCRLVTPAGGLVLDPFAGSGSTGKAAALEGFDFVGIEQEPAYANIARARIAAVNVLTLAEMLS